MTAAAGAVRRGELVVIPTDTVYGIAADAFDPDAVQRLLDAKGRGSRHAAAGAGLRRHHARRARRGRARRGPATLVEAFWPGPLTLVCRQQASLQWDLGETRGTVAVRMPDDEVALAVLERTGPLAVSSANLTGRPAATDADAAEEMLGDAVAVIVDGGTSPGGEASTIVDVTGPEGRVLRLGALSLEQLNAALEEHGVVLTDEG